MTFVVGLTGGSGSGKSAAAGYFEKLGVPVKDVDSVSKDLCYPGLPAFQAIRNHFGVVVINQEGEIDRRKLREIIFHNADERKWLEGILHPPIIEVTLKWIKSTVALYCVVVAPLLLETELKDHVDRILVIDSDEKLQVNRVFLRDGVDKNEIKAMVERQFSREKRLAMADDVILNDGTLEDLQNSVTGLYEFYGKKFTSLPKRSK